MKTTLKSPVLLVVILKMYAKKWKNYENETWFEFEISLIYRTTDASQSGQSFQENIFDKLLSGNWNKSIIHILCKK